MKKVLCFAAAAAMLFAACQKTEIVNDHEGSQEISFVTVNKTVTKTPISGTTFSDGDNMSIAAYLVKGGTAGDFFKETLFTKNGDNWTGGRYWPLSTATISFLAVTETGGGVDKTETEFSSPMASSATVTLDGNNALNQNDLMYAAAQATHTQGTAYSPVDLKFQHALAWIKFKVSTNVTGTNGSVTIHSITLDNAYTDGKLTVGYSNYNTVGTPDLTATWDLSDNTISEEVDLTIPNSSGVATGDVVITSLSTEYGNGVLVIPSGSAESFTIDYTITQGDGTATRYSYTHDFTTPPSWEMAKKYTYNVSINFSEITINPSIATDWADGGTTNI